MRRNKAFTLIELPFDKLRVVRQREREQREREREAFTLIELLVVIAILTLLVSIVMPSLRKAMTLAKITVCLTHVKALVTAHITYAADNRDYFCGGYFPRKYPPPPPPAAPPTFAVYQYNTAGFTGKIGQLYPSSFYPGCEDARDRPLFKYVPPRVTVCPLDVGEVYTLPFGMIMWEMDGTSYVYPAIADKSQLNSCFVNSGIYALEGKKIDQIQSPYKKEFYADDIVLWDRQLGIQQGCPNWHGPEFPSFVSMGFVDGHASKTRVLDFRAGKAETPYGPPLCDWPVTSAVVESIAARQRYY